MLCVQSVHQELIKFHDLSIHTVYRVSLKMFVYVIKSYLYSFFVYAYRVSKRTQRFRLSANNSTINFSLFLYYSRMLDNKCLTATNRFMFKSIKFHRLNGCQNAVLIKIIILLEIIVVNSCGNYFG